MTENLIKYFEGIVTKRLSEVEVKSEKSNQHEFNGPVSFRELFGTEKKVFNSKFIYLTDDPDKIIEDSGTLTWYDARKNVSHRSSEYRFYYSRNRVTPLAEANDLLIVAKTKKDELITIITPYNSTAEQQLLWLFGIDQIATKFKMVNFNTEKVEIGYAGKYIIESLGIVTEEPVKEDYLQLMLATFGGSFPTTSRFSEFARDTLNDVSAREDPDRAIIAWMEREELLFKMLEKHFIENKLKQGFGKDGLDVEDFIKFSLSIHQRRKSRAGWAFDNHLETILKEYGIIYSRQPKTERNKPDYIFPGIDYYKDENFPNDLLTMLGLKTTAKDRWRQILAEADRISLKHLFTLEPAISKNQTDEMQKQRVQLVIPKEIHQSFMPAQQAQLITLSDFLKMLTEKQRIILN